MSAWVESLQWALLGVSVCTSYHRVDPNVPIAIGLIAVWKLQAETKVTMWAISLLSVFTDIFWFVSWQSILAIARREMPGKETADTKWEQYYHTGVIMATLCIIGIKVVSIHRDSIRAVCIDAGSPGLCS